MQRAKMPNPRESNSAAVCPTNIVPKSKKKRTRRKKKLTKKL